MTIGIILGTALISLGLYYYVGTASPIIHYIIGLVTGILISFKFFHDGAH